MAGVQCQICGRFNHSAITCYQRYNHASPSVNMAEINSFTNSTNLFVDSGATHHITNSLQNLDIAQDYTGGDEVNIGNATSISIRHTGSSQYKTLSGIFRLKNLLHVPEITRNLLSVHQFTLDNGVYLEFHPYDVYVKDRQMGRFLFKGFLKDGQYALPLKSARSTSVANISAFSAMKVPLSTWHSRLGHANNLVVNKILSTFHLDHSKDRNNSICQAYM